MVTRLVLVNGIQMRVEVDELNVAADTQLAVDDLASRGLVPTGVADRAAEVGDDLQKMLRAVTGTIHQALEAARPTEFSVELLVGFSGAAGIPCLTRGEANASIKLTAKWSRQGSA
jgi:hypothetical protein